ncbi:MAG: nicotinate-nucleotide--dimethylbenzimidazole phosphoribosyltransferase [Venatoribacter sp.]
MNSYWWQEPAAAVNYEAQDQAKARQLQLTKPLGALGVLEQVAITMAGLQGRAKPEVKQPQLVLFAADHGVVAQGVSAFPQAVTISMLNNFVQGGAAVSVLARHHGIGMSVVNCGTALPCDVAGIVQRPLMAGTHDFSLRPAMSAKQVQQALGVGKEQVERLQQSGCDFFIAGEMGIGNTSSASCMAALLLNQNVVSLTGPGTGVQGEALIHKQKVLSKSVERARPLVKNALQALEQVGGLEIAAMTGAYLRAAQLGIPCLIDGFIATAAALAAVKIKPEVRDWLLFGHHSAEPGHDALLQALNAKPLLHLQMRLGEASGAVAAFPIVQQALLTHNHMATFAEAGVEGAL